jgi:LPXTG-motif cell wall-anchored protein
MIGMSWGPLESRISRRVMAALAAAVLVVVLFVATTGTAHAQNYPVTTPSVEGTSVTTAQVEGTKTTRSEPLPVTGGDILGMTIIGLALIGTGVIVLKVRKRTLAA